MQSVYEAAGSSEGLFRLAEAWHSRVMADEIVSHAFSHGFHPQHTERLAAYWAEAPAWQRRKERERGGERVDRLLVVPPVLAQQILELLVPERSQPVGGTGRPGADLLRADLLEQALLGHLAQRVVNGAGLDAGPFVDAPAHQLAPHVVPVHRLEPFDQAKDHQSRGRHEASVIANVD